MIKQDVTLGIDIGGTNTVFGFVDREGNLISESSISTCPQLGARDLISRLNIEINNLYEKISADYILRGIGMGAPNANYFKGTVENPPNLKWGVINLVELVNEYFDLPVALTNDANASALGEMLFGAAKGMKNFIVITLGTGLGSGIVADGKLIYGADGFAGEIGHTIYDPAGRMCGCGRKGCLETYASATGIKRTVMELLANKNDESVLREISFRELDSKMICSAAMSGDKIALDAFEYTGMVLGIKLADAVAHTNPEAIILFGGLALAGDLIISPTKSIWRNIFFMFLRTKLR